MGHCSLSGKSSAINMERLALWIKRYRLNVAVGQIREPVVAVGACCPHWNNFEQAQLDDLHQYIQRDAVSPYYKSNSAFSYCLAAMHSLGEDGEIQFLCSNRVLNHC